MTTPLPNPDTFEIISLGSDPTTQAGPTKLPPTYSHWINFNGYHDTEAGAPHDPEHEASPAWFASKPRYRPIFGFFKSRAVFLWFLGTLCLVLTVFLGLLIFGVIFLVVKQSNYLGQVSNVNVSISIGANTTAVSSPTPTPSVPLHIPTSQPPAVPNAFVDVYSAVWNNGTKNDYFQWLFVERASEEVVNMCQINESDYIHTTTAPWRFDRSDPFPNGTWPLIGRLEDLKEVTYVANGSVPGSLVYHNGTTTACDALSNDAGDCAASSLIAPRAADDKLYLKLMVQCAAHPKSPSDPNAEPAIRPTESAHLRVES